MIGANRGATRATTTIEQQRNRRKRASANRIRFATGTEGIVLHDHIGNMVGAENYYQYVEHYFRSMRSD
ncbi:MAG: hypothetical protein WA728_32210 [Xanthobacteraceae bacterium]